MAGAVVTMANAGGRTFPATSRLHRLLWGLNGSQLAITVPLKHQALCEDGSADTVPLKMRGTVPL